MPDRLGEGRDLPGGQIAGQNGKCASRDGVAAQPGRQPSAPGRPRQHRRCQPPPRPRSAADAKAASDRMNDFAGSLIPLQAGCVVANVMGPSAQAAPRVDSLYPAPCGGRFGVVLLVWVALSFKQDCEAAGEPHHKVGSIAERCFRSTGTGSPGRADDS